MQYSYEIYPEHELIVEKISGDITIEELIQKTQQLFSDPAYDPTFSGLMDMRGAHSKLSKVELYGFAEMINQSENFGQSPWIIIANDPMVVALSQVFKNRLTNLETIGVVSSVEVAAVALQKPEIHNYLVD